MNVYDVVQDKIGSWRVNGPPVGCELSRHRTKQAAVRYARDSARTTVQARVVIHNEDGTIDFLEHGYGNPEATPPEFLASSSGSELPFVEESIADIISRGARAVIHKGKYDSQSGIEQIRRRQIARPQIVLVDDEQFNLDIEKSALKTIGLTADAYNNPVEAWERIRSGNVALVVTDWNMPQMSGMELLAKVNTLSRPPFVIVVTAIGTADRNAQAVKQGAFDFLEKPFNVKEFIHDLLELVKDAVERHAEVV